MNDVLYFLSRSPRNFPPAHHDITVNGACNSISGITERFMRVRTMLYTKLFVGMSSFRNSMMPASGHGTYRVIALESYVP